MLCPGDLHESMKEFNICYVILAILTLILIYFVLTKNPKSSTTYCGLYSLLFFVMFFIPALFTLPSFGATFDKGMIVEAKNLTFHCQGRIPYEAHLILFQDPPLALNASCIFVPENRIPCFGGGSVWKTHSPVIKDGVKGIYMCFKGNFSSEGSSICAECASPMRALDSKSKALSLTSITLLAVLGALISILKFLPRCNQDMYESVSDEREKLVTQKIPVEQQ